MQKLRELLALVWANLPRYGPFIAAVITGLASIAAGRRHEGIQEILQSVAVITGSVGVTQLHRSLLSRVNEVHISLNSRLDQLVVAARIQGASDERERARAAAEIKTALTPYHDEIHR